MPIPGGFHLGKPSPAIATAASRVTVPAKKMGRSCGSPTDGVVRPTSEIPCHFAAPSKGSAPLPCMSLRAHIDWVALEGHAPNRRSRSRKSFGNGGRTPTLCPTPAKLSSDPFDALQSTAGLDLAA